MREIDGIAPTFRQAMNQWPDSEKLAKHYALIADNWDNDRYGIVTIIKSYIEIVCYTILQDFGEETQELNKTTYLIKQTLKKLGAENQRGGSKFDVILTSHNKIADALNDIRNSQETIAHGKDGFIELFTKNHVRVYVLSADSILALILGVLEGTEINLQHTRAPYDQLKNFHDKIDSEFECEVRWDNTGEEGVVVVDFGIENPIGEIRLKISQLLYHADRPAYVAALSMVNQESATPEVTHLAPTSPEKPEGVHLGKPEIRKRFSSAIPDLVPGSQEIGSEILSIFFQEIAVDWSTRENIQARMKLEFKNVLQKNGIDKKYAQKILNWFKETGFEE